LTEIFQLSPQGQEEKVRSMLLGVLEKIEGLEFASKILP
jgi:hypothetical protein